MQNEFTNQFFRRFRPPFSTGPPLIRLTPIVDVRPYPLPRPHALTTPRNVIGSALTLTTASSRLAPTPRVNSSVQKDKEKYSSLSDSDDSDVDVISDTKLQEEEETILGTDTEIVGHQNEDKNFLLSSPLRSRINRIANKHGLDDCSQEVVSLVSLALENRLKTLVERLGVNVEHRQEQIKNYPGYEVHQDVRGQVMFLRQLDQLEESNRQEDERQDLMASAKRSYYAEDSDQLAVRKRAKQMQRQEMEELRQREANETALQAIGNPKKRQKTGLTSMASTDSGHSLLNPVNRIKRVILEDIQFLMEMDKDMRKSVMLFKSYLK